MTLRRKAKATLTPFNLGHGDGLHFTLSDGRVWELILLDTKAEVLSRCPLGGIAQDTNHVLGEVGSYGFSAQVRINGRELRLDRVVGTQESFYEPWVVDGVTVWFDAAACVFDKEGGFMAEKDWRHGQICQPA